MTLPSTLANARPLSAPQPASEPTSTRGSQHIRPDARLAGLLDGPRVVRAGGCISVFGVRDDFAALAACQCVVDTAVDGLLEEPDRSIGHREIGTAGVKALEAPIIQRVVIAVRP